MMARTLGIALVYLAAWNAVLRPAAEVPVTPYYLAFPLLLTVLVLKSADVRSWLIAFAVFALYGIAVGTAYGVPLVQQAAQLLKYLQLLTFLAMLHVLCVQTPYAVERLTRVVWVLFVMVMALAVIQALTGLEFPTVVNEESSLWLNTFFYTPNDMALFLGGVFCLALTSRLPWQAKAGIAALILVLNLRNDAKAVLLALTLVVLAQAMLVVCQRAHVRPVFGVIALLVLVPALVVGTAEFVLDISNEGVDLVQLLAEPITRISELDPYDLGGSIFDRADALIHALQAFKSTYGLGLGPAGSVYTLSRPEFELLTAQSLHNALAEFVIEFGPAAVAVLVLAAWPVVKSLFGRALSAGQQGRALLLVASSLLTVSQSSGFVSNYAFWLVAFVIWQRVAEPAAAGIPRRAAPISPPTTMRSTSSP
jgi:hypothetical protein